MSIEIKVSVEELRKKKLFLATPCYGGMCHGMYARSLADLSAQCTHYGISLQIYMLFNESLITRARAYCCDEFMRSDATHMLFLDSDIGFDARDAIAMLAMMSDDTEYDVMAAPYPKKCISWEKIKMAVDKGFADKDPQVLDKFVGDFVFNPKAGVTSFAVDRPVEVLETGTGFMMIRKQTLARWRDAFPQYWYKPDHVRTEHFDGSREIMMYFQAEIDPKSRRYLSEDYFFSQKCQEIGMKIWLCPWMRTSHVGSFVFGGSLQDLANLGASATADVGVLNDIKEKNRAKK